MTVQRTPLEDGKVTKMKGMDLPQPVYTGLGLTYY